MSLPTSWDQQKTAAEEIEARLPKHPAFEHFEAIDLALHRPLAPRQHEPDFDCVVVFRQPLSKMRVKVQGLNCCCIGTSLVAYGTSEGMGRCA